MVFAPSLIASAALSAETPSFLNDFLPWLTNSILVNVLVVGIIVWIVRSCTRRIR